MDEKEKRKKKRGKRGALSGAGADDGCGRGACAPRAGADDGCGRGARAPRAGADDGCGRGARAPREGADDGCGRGGCAPRAGADDGCGRGARAPRVGADDGCGRGACAPRAGALSGGEWEEMGRGLLPIHVREAVAVLRDGEAHWVRAWKQKDGSLIEYRRARMVGEYVRGGVVRLRMEGSGLVRAMRWVCMVGIDGVEVYL